MTEENLLQKYPFVLDPVPYLERLASGEEVLRFHIQRPDPIDAKHLRRCFEVTARNYDALDFKKLLDFQLNNTDYPDKYADFLEYDYAVHLHGEIKRAEAFVEDKPHLAMWPLKVEAILKIIERAIAEVRLTQKKESGFNVNDSKDDQQLQEWAGTAPYNVGMKLASGEIQRLADKGEGSTAIAKTLFGPEYGNHRPFLDQSLKDLKDTEKEHKGTLTKSIFRGTTAHAKCQFILKQCKLEGIKVDPMFLSKVNEITP